MQCVLLVSQNKTKQQQKTQEAKNSFGKDQYVHHFLNFQITTYLLPECSIQGPPCTSAVCKMCFLPLSSVLLPVLGWNKLRTAALVIISIQMIVRELIILLVLEHSNMSNRNHWMKTSKHNDLILHKSSARMTLFSGSNIFYIQNSWRLVLQHTASWTYEIWADFTTVQRDLETDPYYLPNLKPVSYTHLTLPTRRGV